MHRIYATVMLVGLAWSVGCGGSTSDSSSAGAAGAGGGASGTGGSAGTGGASGGSAGSGGSSSGNCPLTPPDDGSSCTPPWSSDDFNSAQAHCTWGDDPRPGCRTTAQCTNGAWRVQQPDAQACAAPPLPAGCPSPLPSDGTVCPEAELACWYDDGARCWCSACAGGSGYPTCQHLDPPEWFCSQPAADCPAVLPQAGTPCDVDGASCGPNCELVIQCTGGVWQWLQGNCPVCAAPDTPIATPSGDRPIASLRPGDLVYSVECDAFVAVPVARVGRTPVASHRVVRVVLDSGVVLQLSPGHPTFDGRTFGDLTASARLDDSQTVLSATLVPYEYDATYDILPASSTGAYVAGGALVGSSLFHGDPRAESGACSQRAPEAMQTAPGQALARP